VPQPERPGARRLYLDTSAYLCILLAEEGAELLSEETSGAELLSSVLLVLEARRNVIRLAREGILTGAQYQACMDRLEEDVELFVLRDLTLELGSSHVLPPVAMPGTLSLAHLRTALWFHTVESIDRFVTTDAFQAQAARELGLPV
jgi:hypothetical protein